jgi:uracil-DNA glycosylase family protein
MELEPGYPPGGVDAFAGDAHTLGALADAARGCRACPLWANATQTVFGEGPPDARVMLVGEQPGDQEDQQGRPFVGPAGGVLDRALALAGVDREAVYLTNAVKHFKNVPRGKRRLHQKPNAREIAVCERWAEREIAAVRPDVIVCLGATAASAVLGRSTPIGKNRGVPLEAAGTAVFLTWHPSAILRADDADRERLFRELAADLELAVTRARPG